MNTLIICPGCGFRGRLPEGVTGVKSIGCPNCNTVVPIEQVRPPAAAGAPDTSPICVDGAGGFGAGALGVPAAVMPQGFPAPGAAGDYSGDYMRDEAMKFAQYTTSRLSELHRKRLELAEAESRFEAMCVSQKQTIHDQRVANAARADQLARREAELQAKVTALNAHAAESERREAELQAKEAELATREADLTAREARLAEHAAETDFDSRAAELHDAAEQLEAWRAELVEERVALDQRAELLDRTETALHRRSAELDEVDERLRQEQEEWERVREEQEQAAREPAG